MAAIDRIRAAAKSGNVLQATALADDSNYLLQVVEDARRDFDQASPHKAMTLREVYGLLRGFAEVERAVASAKRVELASRVDALLSRVERLEQKLSAAQKELGALRRKGSA